MSWICYLLHCADDTLYCGITNDLDKRLGVHNAGEGAKYTRGRTPVTLVYQESCTDKSAALKREIQIKRLSRAKKLALYNAGESTNKAPSAHKEDADTIEIIRKKRHITDEN
jgi:putative endonuclease